MPWIASKATENVGFQKPSQGMLPAISSTVMILPWVVTHYDQSLIVGDVAHVPRGIMSSRIAIVLFARFHRVMRLG